MHSPCQKTYLCISGLSLLANQLDTSTYTAGPSTASREAGSWVDKVGSSPYSGPRSPGHLGDQWQQQPNGGCRRVNGIRQARQHFSVAGSHP